MATPAKTEKPFQTEINAFTSVDISDDPASISDDKAAFLMNFVPMGRSLKTAPSLSDDIISLPDSFYALFMLDVLLSDGTYKVIFDDSGVAFYYDNAFGSVAGEGPLVCIGAGSAFAHWPGSGTSNPSLIIVHPTQGLFNLIQTGAGTAGLSTSAVDVTITGTAVAVWKNRVWVADGKTIKFSKVGSYNTGAAFDADGAISDSFESITSITALIPTQDYLYVIGDYGIHVISGITVTDDAITTFNLSEALPGIGTTNAKTIKVFGNLMYLVANNEVYVISGASFQIISDAIRGYFDFAPALLAFFATIYGKRTYCIMSSVTNPINGKSQYWFACYYASRWFFVMFDDFNQDAERHFETAYASVDAYGNPVVYAAFADNTHNYSQIVQLFVSGASNTTNTTECTRKIVSKFFNFGNSIKDKQIIKVGVKIKLFPQANNGFTPNMTVIGDSISEVSDDSQALVLPDAYRRTTGAADGTARFIMACSPNVRGKEIQFNYEEYGNALYSFNGIVVEGTVGAEW